MRSALPFIAVSLAVGLLFGVGCSSESSSTGIPATAETIDGGAQQAEAKPDASAERPDGSRSVDAAVERETEIVQVMSVVSGTCAESCAFDGYECTPSCEFQSSYRKNVAGHAEYEKVPLSAGDPRGFVTIETCSERIEDKTLIGGEQHVFAFSLCCCARTKK